MRVLKFFKDTPTLFVMGNFPVYVHFIMNVSGQLGDYLTVLASIGAAFFVWMSRFGEVFREKDGKGVPHIQLGIFNFLAAGISLAFPTDALLDAFRLTFMCWGVANVLQGLGQNKHCEMFLGKAKNMLHPMFNFFTNPLAWWAAGDMLATYQVSGWAFALGIIAFALVLFEPLTKKLPSKLSAIFNVASPVNILSAKFALGAALIFGTEPLIAAGYALFAAGYLALPSGKKDVVQIKPRSNAL